MKLSTFEISSFLSEFEPESADNDSYDHVPSPSSPEKIHKKKFKKNSKSQPVRGYRAYERKNEYHLVKRPIL